jgi:beta-ureidopropionase / N-carbamoyl-L-amino-acid hydrolase
MTLTPDADLARNMFRELEQGTRVGRGIVRDTYGKGENFAHALAERIARTIGLEIERDAALNLYMTLPGRDRDLPSIVTGSHMDSVPQGGNYDGAAGVVAGLAAVAGLTRAGIEPKRDVTVMAVRGEEAAWFDSHYIGSKAAFGKFPAADFAVLRSDNKRPLGDCMAEAGCDLDALRRGEAHFKPGDIHAYLEVHIEQGPVLENAGLPVGIVTGIRGCLRHSEARCFGTYAHSGATPRTARRDAVAATVELLQRLDETWSAIERDDGDLVFTVGQLHTDPGFDGPSKVAGETRFVLDFRGLEDAVMQRASDTAVRLAAEIGARRNVRFELGAPSYSTPAVLDRGIRRTLSGLAVARKIPSMELASGAGHDAAIFSSLGVPSGMIFIRNAHGSHNPDEAMALEDFSLAAGLLAAYIAEDAG